MSVKERMIESLKEESRALCVLVVEDEELVQKMTRAALGKGGLEVLMASNGEEGVDLYREHHASIDVLLVDMTLPGIDGAEVLSSVRAINPEAKVLIMSGHTQSEIEDRFVDQQPNAYVHKPFRVVELNDLVRKFAGAST